MFRKLAAITLMVLVTPMAPLVANEIWEPLHGPLGGDVRCIATHPDSAHIVYLGLGHHGTSKIVGTGGGLFVSTNGGESWSRSELQGVAVSGIGRSHSQLVAATYGNGIYAAENPAGPWVEANEGLEDLRIRALLINEAIAVVGTESGPYFGDPDLLTWEPAEISTVRDIWALAQSPWDPDFLLAATDSSIWRSEDGGRNWVESGAGMAQTEVRSIAFGSDGRCWAGGLDDWNVEGRLYCSADSGFTWTEAYQPPQGRADAVWSILVSPLDPDQILIGIGAAPSGRGYIYRTLDGGVEWEEVLMVRCRSFRAIEFIPTPDHAVLAGCESSFGVFRTTNEGTTWSPVLDGLDAANVFDITLADESTGMLVVGKGFSGTFTRGDDWGITWANMDTLFPSVWIRDMLVWPDNPDRILAAAWNDVYLSEDGGMTWQNQSLSSHNIDVAMSPLDTDLIYAGGTQGLYVSRDGAESWEGPDSTVDRYVTSLAVDPRDAFRALVSTRSRIYETTDAGATWDTLATFGCTCLEIHPLERRVIYAGTEDYGVYVSEDNGVTFDQRVDGLTDQSVNAIIADPQDPQRIWAGTPSGIYKTVDMGATWVPDNAGLENTDIHSFMIHDASRRIFVGSYSGGIRQATIVPTDVDDPPPGSNTPLSLRLLLAPIPCRDFLSVGPIIPRTAGFESTPPVAIKLYAVNGRLVRSIQTRAAEPVSWDLRGLPAGSYIVTASYAGIQGTAPVILAR